MELTSTRRERVERYLWLREPRTRDRTGSRTLVCIGVLVIVLPWLGTWLDALEDGYVEIPSSMYWYFPIGLLYICLGTGELLYSRRRRLAVLLRLSAFFVFFPLICVFLATMLYSAWFYADAVELSLFVLILAVILLLSYLQGRSERGVDWPGGARGES